MKEPNAHQRNPVIGFRAPIQIKYALKRLAKKNNTSVQKIVLKIVHDALVDDNIIVHKWEVNL